MLHGYIVEYCLTSWDDDGNIIKDVPEYFVCQADDSHHAVEQCADALKGQRHNLLSIFSRIIDLSVRVSE